MGIVPLLAPLNSDTSVQSSDPNPKPVVDMTPARRHILLAVLVVVLPNACNIGTHGRPCNVHYVVVPAPNGGPAPEGLDEALDAASKPTTSKAWPKISTAVAGVRTQAGYEDEGPKCGVPQPRVRIVNGKESKQVLEGFLRALNLA